MCNAQTENHLALPQRQCVDQCGLDLLRHLNVAVLDHTDLRRVLQADIAGELQVIKLLLEALTFVCQIICFLRILRILCLRRLGSEFSQFTFADFGEFFLTCCDVHAQLFEIHFILVVQAIEHGDILDQGSLMFLKLLRDPVDRYFTLLITRFKCVDLADFAV